MRINCMLHVLTTVNLLFPTLIAVPSWEIPGELQISLSLTFQVSKMGICPFSRGCGKDPMK